MEKSNLKNAQRGVKQTAKKIAPIRGNRRLLIPKTVREALDLEAGDSVALYTSGGDLIIEPWAHGPVVVIKTRMRVTLPADVRDRLGLRLGDQYQVRDQHQRISVKKTADGMSTVQWMLPLPNDMVEKYKLAVGDSLAVSVSGSEVVFRPLGHIPYQAKLDKEYSIALPRTIRSELSLAVGDLVQIQTNGKKITVSPFR